MLIKFILKNQFQSFFFSLSVALCVFCVLCVKKNREFSDCIYKEIAKRVFNNWFL